MSLKLTVASFLACVKKSGLLDPQRVDALVQEFQKEGTDCSESSSIAAAFVKHDLLTEWQSEKLLQGRHMGFILGRYKLLSLLGAGEMSSVYLAEHVLMERKCAIKVLPANKVQDTSYLERFHREALAVASMNHMNIVRAYDVDKKTENGTDIHFLVMEYIEGKNLEQTVKEIGPLEFVLAVDYIRQAADGLAHAHQLQMVHRDIKPGNLLIDSTGCVKVLDLGLARFFKPTTEESLTIKHDEKVLGTADYLAPEQAVDSHHVDARADIYSLGCTLYFALTGHSPFTDGTLVQRLLAHQTKTPPTVRYERPDIDDELLEILDKMLAKKCADRYQSATELSETLTRWLIRHAPAAWKRKHISLVASLNAEEDLYSDQSREEASALVLNRQHAVAANEQASEEEDVVQAPAVALSPNLHSERQTPKNKKPTGRNPGSSVRLASAASETAINRDVPPIRHVARRLTMPAPVAVSTVDVEQLQTREAVEPSVRRVQRQVKNITHTSVDSDNSIEPTSEDASSVMSTPSQNINQALILVAMLLVILFCGFGVWYFVNKSDTAVLKTNTLNMTTTFVAPKAHLFSV